ncbi:class I SAM-dependent methyltransferase [Cohnella sp. LGH]|uniref:N-6 DNA methylase n=1 Tax=Cohnella sp. LGH TaxID=1619153 RepID=UPI001AD98009|nr:N-6 DNA methylase [Cohnella sp. LGH]QTH40530.1 class I SAM-dependent methyltransferase [Cohnella sp. LGH]
MKSELTHQKLRGGYYTPKPITDFITRWAVSSPTATILEPSCGDGNFLESMAQTYRERGLEDRDRISRQICAIEFDPEEARKAQERLESLGIPAGGAVRNGDFFSYCRNFIDGGVRFEAIVGNPPFIRYQSFMEEHRKLAFEIMQEAGLTPNRFTNAWVPFLIASSLLLTDKGRMGMVVPAELFQVGYAAQTRLFLSDYFRKLTIITFKKLVFSEINQEVVLLLCEKDGDRHSGIRVVELEEMGDLQAFDPKDLSNIELKPLDHTSEKWTQYYLTADEITLLRKWRTHPEIAVSGDILDVDVGVVTGLNEFFALNELQVAKNKLGAHTKRIITKSAHLEGVVMTEEDWADNVARQYATALLHLPNVPFSEQAEEVRQYIVSGEKQGVHTGYKCRIRKNWFVVPSVWVPDAFMLRQVHSYPKIILNEAQATCTDTVHRVRFKEGYEGARVSAAFLNSLTLAFSEVTGRSYGAGVLTFEPSETESLPLPLRGADKLDVEQIDQLIRFNRIEEVLEITDKALLIDGLGLAREEALALRKIWRKLRDRRINRR